MGHQDSEIVLSRAAEVRRRLVRRGVTEVGRPIAAGLGTRLVADIGHLHFIGRIWNVIDSGDDPVARYSEIDQPIRYNVGRLREAPYRRHSDRTAAIAKITLSKSLQIRHRRRIEAPGIHAHPQGLNLRLDHDGKALVIRYRLLWAVDGVSAARDQHGHQPDATPKDMSYLFHRSLFRHCTT